MKFINVGFFFYLNVWHTQLKSYNIKFGNHKNSQGVNPDNSIKTERFGCVYTGNEGTDAAWYVYFTTIKHSHSIS